VPESADIPTERDAGAGVASLVDEAPDSESDEHGHYEEDAQTDGFE
jgi:hypothetical protein